jgi:ketosteroid isomerase-like protein
MNNDTQIENEVKEFFNEFVKAYPKEDIDRYLNLFAQNENLVMFGTSEKWLGWDEYKDAPAEEKERFEDISLEYEWLKVNSQGDVAWIASEVIVTLKVGVEIITIPARLTGVVAKKENQWKIVQGHISIVPS